MKVEVYLKLRKIPYEIRLADPRKAPKKKLPFIVDGAKTIADSSAILAHLESAHGPALDEGLGASARASAHVLKRTLEESLYFVLMWGRWGDEMGWQEFKPDLDRAVPAAVRWFVPGLIRKKVLESTVAQGIGRHSREEILAFGKADVEAVATVLGDQPYFLGEELRTIDVVAYSFLAQALLPTTPTLMTEATRAHPTLVAFVDRVRGRLRAAA
jgi:glutathione S-transferase